jgi:hypothetical protein
MACVIVRGKILKRVTIKVVLSARVSRATRSILSSADALNEGEFGSLSKGNFDNKRLSLMTTFNAPLEPRSRDNIRKRLQRAADNCHFTFCDRFRPVRHSNYPLSASYLERQKASAASVNRRLIAAFTSPADFPRLACPGCRRCRTLPCAFDQAIEAGLLNGLDMHEHIVAAAVRRDKAVPLCQIEPRDCPAQHRQRSLAKVTPRG